MADNPKSIVESFEEMTVSPTPGSPCRVEDTATGPPPKEKINFQLEVHFKDQITKKPTRILPTASMHDFLEKLTKKKYLPSSSALGGVHLRNDHMSVFHGPVQENLEALPLTKWSCPLWNSGFRENVRNSSINVNIQICRIL